jgi:hypothetical protein
MFGTNKNTNKLPGPCGIPEIVGRHMVTVENKDADWVWNLKGLIRPTDSKKVFYCRVFSERETAKLGIKIKDWTSLDGHPELIVWEGDYDKDSFTANRKKFEESTQTKST